MNRELLALYWQLGRDILDRQAREGWGAGVIDQVSVDLRIAFPEMKGFSRSNLKYMRAFAEAWPDLAIGQPPVGQLPWAHHLVLLTKLKSKEERLAHAEEALRRGWSRNALALHIENRTLGRQGQALTNFEQHVPKAQSDLARESLKDPYRFDFLGVGSEAGERAIEGALVQPITRFLLELGAGFAFVGRQVHLEVGGDDFYIDLLFYHLKLRAYVVIELKAGDCKPEHTGQLSFYLTAVDEQVKAADDAPTIGLLLCRSKNRVVAEYALRDTNKPMGVAEYQLVEALPKDLETSLPSIESKKTAPSRPEPSHAKPNAPITPTAASATTEDQQLRVLAAAACTEVALPADAFVVGEPITAVAIIYAGHPRAGLTLTCTRGQRHFSVALAHVVFPPGSEGARFVARYRAWLGLGEAPSTLELADPTPASRHKVTSDDIAIGSPIELIVLACKSNALRCRLLGTARELTLRTAVNDEVPGGIITVLPTKLWTHARHTYLAGTVLAMRMDVAALGLVPLALHDQGEWDPEAAYWGEEGEPIEAWAKLIIARGPRPMFEMEQVLPGTDPENFDEDPIVEASELNAAGDGEGARQLLMGLLARDLRCLDAHAHLGNFEFDRNPAQARRHYELGVSIGALTLGATFEDVLAWGLIDNRPFLRCLHGVGLSCWRLGQTHEAAAVFRRMLWLNPSDNQGARFNLAAIEAGQTWDAMET